MTKRDGRAVPFDITRIERAVSRCFDEDPIERNVSARDIAEHVETDVVEWHGRGIRCDVEQIQDMVEECLIGNGFLSEARRYMRYRDDHAKQREDRPIPDDVREAFDADRQYFPTALQQFQFYDKYSRFNYDLGRRETWVETVDRTVSFLRELSQDCLSDDVYQRIREGILRMDVMPSMRLLAMAGPAARRNNIAIYNCSFRAVDSLDAFHEALLISMAGCGVGFSVERQFTEQLPVVAHLQEESQPYIHIVEDSAEGWASAVEEGISGWFQGFDTLFDYRGIRPAGAILKTKGGRASGPEPLQKLLAFCRQTILGAQGRKLRPIEVHDMMCMVGSAAVSGGVRRTAMISLFDQDDQEMLHAKDGDLKAKGLTHRWNANNSMVWQNVATTSQQEFIHRFMAMVDGGNGEPGIFSRENARLLMPDRRDKDHEFGTNPCGEIILRSEQFCNLSAAIARADDTLESLARKVTLAAIIGTIQSMATHFPGLGPKWKTNCEEERLLGVDITGQMDNRHILKNPLNLKMLQSVALLTNEAVAAALGINPSAAVTCVKPSGNTSTLVNCASGLHARWAQYELRNVRVSATSPITKVLRDAGVPMVPEADSDPDNVITWVAQFPVAAPEGAITKDDLTAVEQCEWWLHNKLNWTEHNPSVTISYRPDEILPLMQWVYGHRDKIGGMAFFPAFISNLPLLPRNAISREEHDRLKKAFPESVDFSKVYRYEREDYSKASSLGACEGPVCAVEV